MLNNEDLTQQYKELCSVYGDALNRLRSLTAFLTDVETKLDDIEKLFKIIGAQTAEAGQLSGATDE